jgi:hypothetical protein
MGSFTLASASCTDKDSARASAILVMLLSCCLVGCKPGDEDFGIRLEALQAVRTPAGLAIEASQQIRLSSEARTALRHGVPLRIRIDLELEDSSRWSPDAAESFAYEIRYLPLSDHYQLTGPGIPGVGENVATRTFPRLRHVLAAMSDISLRLAASDVTPGVSEVRLRSRLDRSGMPGPMQLPVFFSPDWRHDSGWVTAHVDLSG